MRFSALCDRYEDEELVHRAPNSRRTYRTSLGAFRSFLVDQGGNLPAHEVRKGHVKAFMNWRRLHSPAGEKRTRPVSARTVAKDRVILHVVFSSAEELEVVESNPVAKTSPPEGDQREPVILTGDQHEALLRACEGRPMLRRHPLGPPGRGLLRW